MLKLFSHTTNENDGKSGDEEYPSENRNAHITKWVTLNLARQAASSRIYRVCAISNVLRDGIFVCYLAGVNTQKIR